jgi:CBS domain-containing protein
LVAVAWGDESSTFTASGGKVAGFVLIVLRRPRLPGVLVVEINLTSVPPAVSVGEDVESVLMILRRPRLPGVLVVDAGGDKSSSTFSSAVGEVAQLVIMVFRRPRLPAFLAVEVGGDASQSALITSGNRFEFALLFIVFRRPRVLGVLAVERGLAAQISCQVAAACTASERRVERLHGVTAVRRCAAPLGVLDTSSSSEIKRIGKFLKCLSFYMDN